MKIIFNETHEECQLSHEANEITKEALEKVKQKKGLTKAATVEELFKKLGK